MPEPRRQQIHPAGARVRGHGLPLCQRCGIEISRYKTVCRDCSSYVKRSP